MEVIMVAKEKASQWVGLSEITQRYLPVSKKKARQFVKKYLEPKMIGNQLFVSRNKLEVLLNNDSIVSFPLN